jgi:signal transduction histidine kinase
MTGQDDAEARDYEQLLFWLRWPYWAAVILTTLLNRGADIDSVTLVAILAVAAGVNIILFVLLRLHVAPRIVLPAFSAVDIVVMAALLVATGDWPTPLYPLLLLPLALVALRWGPLAGMGAGFVFALAGLASFSLQGTERLAALPRLDSIVALVSLPVIGGVVGWAASHAAGNRLRTLSAEVEELRFARDRSDAIYAMASTLGATLNYQRVLDTFFDVSAIEFRAIGLEPRSMTGIALLFEDRSGERLNEPMLRVSGGINLNSEDWALRCPAKQGALARVLATSQPEILSDVAADAELGHIVALKGACSAILVPLRAGFESYGVILFASGQENAYDINRCHFLLAFSNQVTIALQNARLVQSLRDEQDRIIDRQEEARRQIARELHDGPTQTIAALAMRLNYARVLLNHNVEKASKELEELEDLARKTTKEIRTMLFTLRPVVLETQGLAAALRQYGERLQEMDGLVLAVDDTEFRGTLSEEMAGVVFSILEEAIHNAKKHAQAQRVVVTLRRHDDSLIAQVQDDGIGFDVSAVEQSYDQRGSLGLLNMKERATLIEGNLVIRSSPGQGTTITLAAPLTRQRPIDSGQVLASES